MNNLNLSDGKLNALLNMAGKKMGQDPQALKQRIQDGKLDEVISGLEPSAKEKISGLLGDPKKLEALMQDEKVKSLLSGFMGTKK